MTKTTALALCRLIELLKAVEHTFHRRSMLLAETFNYAVQLLCHKAIGIIRTAKVRCTFSSSVSLANVEEKGLRYNTIDESETCVEHQYRIDALTNTAILVVVCNILHRLG